MLTDLYIIVAWLFTVKIKNYKHKLWAKIRSILDVFFKKYFQNFK